HVKLIYVLRILLLQPKVPCNDPYCPS
ncbi:imidazoleglycerol-phosphate dehydratase, partial [Escherichia coli]|nr:imidazoleglycerol-phosphate dehydratase [Escherichia coli]